MPANICHFPDQDHTPAADLLGHSGADNDPAVRAKLQELQSWTLCYNREMLRITRELNELRSRNPKAA